MRSSTTVTMLCYLVTLALLVFGGGVQAQSPYIGEIRIFAGNFEPMGWAFCNGQLLAISENEALFNLIGTTFGGDGQQTFALPNLQSRSPIHQGQGGGLSNRVMGDMAGVEEVTLTTSQIPSHVHGINAVGNNVATQSSPANAYWGMPTLLKPYSPGSSDTNMNAGAMGSMGGSQPHDNMPPYLVGFLLLLASQFLMRLD